MKNLRSEVIKLASRKPHLRAHLLPLLGGTTVGRKASRFRKAQQDEMSPEEQMLDHISGKDFDLAWEIAQSEDLQDEFYEAAGKKLHLPSGAVEDWLLENHGSIYGFDSIEEAFQGKFKSLKDYAYQLVDDLGADQFTQYFDVEKFAKDLKYDGWVEGKDAENEDGYVEDSDGEPYEGVSTLKELVEQWVDDGTISDDKKAEYIDYEWLGDELRHDYWLGDNGYVFRHM